MHKHQFFALCLKTLQCQHAIAISFDDTSLKHLTLIRINSGREKANGPLYI